MNYTEYITALGQLLVVPTTEANFVAIMPRAIEYAEGRIYKDMDFLAMRDTNTSVSTANGVRSVSMPATLVVLEQIGLTAAGKTQMLRERALEWINAVYSDRSITGVPQYFARQDEATVLLAKVPNAVYPLEITGKFRPTAISDSNANTYISLNHPELLIAASMVFLSGYQRDFSAQASDSARATSWEGQYGILLKASLQEEARRKGEGPDRSPYPPAPLVEPGRR